jgi:hypothetical protein
MPIRGRKNPFPKKMKPTNSGIFSRGTKGGSQKTDPQPSFSRAVKAARREAMANHIDKPGA